MCNSSPEPTIPDWINTYQCVDEADETLLANFRKLYASAGNPKTQQRTIALIWKQIVNHLDHHSTHQDYDEVISQTYLWLNTPLIILTNDLREWLEHYCETSDEKIAQKLLEYLNNLKVNNLNSLEYRKAERYTRHWTEKLRNKLKEDDVKLFQQLESKTQRLPRIAFIKPGQPSLSRTLTRWINEYMSWRILDLYIADNEAPDSLHTPVFDDNQDGDEKLDQVLKNLQDATTLDELLNGNLITELSDQEYSNLLIEIKNYLQNDPHDLLASRHIPKVPDCTYKLLAERLILQDEPDSIRSIAHEFGIAEQKLYSQRSRNFLPFIAAIPLYLGYEPEEVRQTIEHDPNGELAKTIGNPARCKACTPQFLARKLLPMFFPAEEIFATVVQHLQRQGYPVKTELLAIYQESSFAVFQIIAETLNEQLEGEDYQVRSYEVLACWETAKMQAITAELIPQCRNLKFKQIQEFWQEKCLLRLGKLAVDVETTIELNRKLETVDPDAFRSAILQDTDQMLRKCNKKKFQVCNAQFIAPKILPFFHTGQEVFTIVVEALRKRKHEITLEEIPPPKHPAFVYKTITNTLINQGGQISSYVVQTYWEQNRLEIISSELQQQGCQLDSDEIYTFWKNSCLPSLGKLATEINQNQSQGSL
ncbi:MAG: hypothetical protein ACLFQP_12380 [Halothece sp.]